MSESDNITWQSSAHEYRELIQNPEWDSWFLREQGLKPNILELAGDCSKATVLDAGTGTGWLFDVIRPAQAFACDVVVPENFPNGVKFDKQSVEYLNYSDGTFDIVIASLLMMFCERIDLAFAEFFRVSKDCGGQLIISLTHPYFYRTGRVTDDEHYLVTEDLSRPSQTQIKIAGQVGPLVYYYRPLPDYLNGLIAAGWKIVELRDWFIDIEKYKQVLAGGMKSEISRTGRIPLYTFVKCEKP